MNKIWQIINYNPADRHVYFLLLSSPVLLTIYRYFGAAKNFTQYFPSLLQSPTGEMHAVIFQFSVFFLLMFVLPLFYIKSYWKKPLRDFGFQKGDFRWGLFFVLIAVPAFVLPFTYAGSIQLPVQSEYPLAKVLLANHELLPVYLISYALFYYVAWEFFFRGFLLFGLAERFGGLNAILIQTISSCLVHIDKPAVEIIGSIPVGILFGIVALRTKSFWYVFLVHAAIGISTDLFIIFNHR